MEAGGDEANLFPYHSSFLSSTRDRLVYDENELIPSKPFPAPKKFASIFSLFKSIYFYAVYYSLLFLLFHITTVDLTSTLILLALPNFLFFLSKFEHEQPKRGMPKRIILVRHAESEGNTNQQIYQMIPDNKVQITAKGEKQAIEAGKKLRNIVSDENVHFFVSPYTRSKQTLINIIAGMKISASSYIISEDPRLREQDWGNFQIEEEMKRCTAERSQFGPFYYRFPKGEAGSDVFVRITSFISTLHREFRACKGLRILSLSAMVSLCGYFLCVISNGLWLSSICCGTLTTANLPSSNSNLTTPTSSLPPSNVIPCNLLPSDLQWAL